MFKKTDRASDSAIGSAPVKDERASVPTASSAMDNQARVPSSPPASPAAGASRDDISIISSGLKVIGNLESEDDIQINGRVEGDVRSRTLTILENAQVVGSVAADTVHIFGSVRGQVMGTLVKIAQSGQIEGDIAYQRISIEEGAVLEGRVSRISNAGKPATAPAAKPASAPKAAAPAAPIADAATGGNGGAKPEAGKSAG